MGIKEKTIKKDESLEKLIIAARNITDHFEDFIPYKIILQNIDSFEKFGEILKKELESRGYTINIGEKGEGYTINVKKYITQQNYPMKYFK